MAAASPDPTALAVVVEGGTVTAADGYRFHTFGPGDHTLTVSGGEIVLDVLVVSGGGGGEAGRDDAGGGGGGGGDVVVAQLTLAAGEHRVQVGTGGSGGAGSAGANGSPGGESRILRRDGFTLLNAVNSI